MKPKRLGCFTASGILAAVLTLLVIVGAGFLSGGEMFSPGGLNSQTQNISLGGINSHAELTHNCSACHTVPVFGQTMSERCRVCHTDLDKEPQNFHRVMLAQAATEACYRCHTEHHGANAPLTVTGLSEFPHNMVGYSLQGHAKKTDGADFTCADCHPAGYVNYDQMVCQTCHLQIDAVFMQQHFQAYGQECLVCHDGVDRFGKGFDHNKFAFKLLGKHGELECSRCHAAARKVDDFKTAAGLTLPAQDCAGCHLKDDAHNGQFGQSCGDCHKPEGWKPASFDHSKAAFQLLGKHAQVTCDGCHQTSAGKVFKGTPTACFACHQKDDAHQSKFGQDCAGCHIPDSWQQASFDHSKSAFPLTGAHQQVQCAQCHVNNVFKGTSQECAACHTDPAYHQGLFGSDCKACHTTDAWTPAQFTSAHNFPINHGERGFNTCQACHPTSLAVYDCYSCHDRNETAAKHRGEGIAKFDDCIRCHANGGGGD